jgi:hypothetical protein
MKTKSYQRARTWALALAAAGLAVVFAGSTAHAAGFSMSKQCLDPDNSFQKLQIGDAISPGCIMTYAWDSSDLPSTWIQINTAGDAVDQDVDGTADCFPNLNNKITAVTGNADCTPDGAGFQLPCLVCQGLAPRTNGALSCTGASATDGKITFQNVAGTPACELLACPDPLDVPNDFDKACDDTNAPCNDDGDCNVDQACLPRVGDDFSAGAINQNGENASGIVGGTSVCQPEVICPEVEIEKVADCVLDEQDYNSVQLCRFSWEVTNTSVEYAAEGCVVTDAYEAPESTCADVGNPAGCDDTSGAAVWTEATNVGDIPPGGVVPGGADQPLIAGLVNVATVECSGHGNEECPEPPYDEAVCTCGDDYKCYLAKEPGRRTFQRQTVSLDDQFSSSTADVLTPYELCNPVDKNGEGVSDPYGHLMCYKIRSYAPRERYYVTDTDQFGDEELLVSSAVELCVPAIKNDEGERSLEELERVLNHYQCYRASGQPAIGPFQAGLEDQFESKVTNLNRTSLHCNPTVKHLIDDGDYNGTNFVPDPTKHLKCYDISDAPGQEAPFSSQIVTVQDQFGTRTIEAGRASRLCEEACKNGECGAPTCDPQVPGVEGDTCGTTAGCTCDTGVPGLVCDANPNLPGSAGTCVVFN